MCVFFFFMPTALSLPRWSPIAFFILLILILPAMMQEGITWYTQGWPFLVSFLIQILKWHCLHIWTWVYRVPAGAGSVLSDHLPFLGYGFLQLFLKPEIPSSTYPPSHSSSQSIRASVRFHSRQREHSDKQVRCGLFLQKTCPSFVLPAPLRSCWRVYL